MKNELTTLDHYTNDYFKALAPQLGTNAESLRVILQAEQGGNLKNFLERNEEQARQALQKTIFGLIEVYTNAPLRDSEGITGYAEILIGTCIKNTLKRYKHFSIEDLKEAFSSAHENGVNLEAWYGKFSAGAYLKVLEAYNKKRNQIRQKHDKIKLLIDQQKEEAQKEQLNEAARAEILKAYEDLKTRAREGEKITEEAVPVFWGPILKKLGVLSVSDVEKVKIHEEAKKDALRRLKLAYMDKNKSSFEKNSIKDAINKALNNIKNGLSAADVPEVKNLSEVIYKKRVVLASIKNDIKNNKQ